MIHHARRDIKNNKYFNLIGYVSLIEWCDTNSYKNTEFWKASMRIEKYVSASGLFFHVIARSV
jgi:hypothetical protein